mmetsp:Transcript_44404/g.102641  ORF Transcript_44404/g.102641 Transcript_44404/m.102641 type:complete len:280 (+) Transcript_44404:143-982(+)
MSCSRRAACAMVSHSAALSSSPTKAARAAHIVHSTSCAALSPTRASLSAYSSSSVVSKTDGSSVEMLTESPRSTKVRRGCVDQSGPLPLPEPPFSQPLVAYEDVGQTSKCTPAEMHASSCAVSRAAAYPCPMRLAPNTSSAVCTFFETPSSPACSVMLRPRLRARAKAWLCSLKLSGLVAGSSASSPAAMSTPTTAHGTSTRRRCACSTVDSAHSGRKLIQHRIWFTTIPGCAAQPARSPRVTASMTAAGSICKASPSGPVPAGSDPLIAPCTSRRCGE